MAVRDILSRLAPGQFGTLSQGAGKWREVHFKLVRDNSILLGIITTKGEGTISPETPALLQTMCDNGILRIIGNIKVNAANDYDFFPHESHVNVVNRRESFRVPVSLRGELAGFKSSGETEKTIWKCTMRDMSLGGARLFVPSPAPAPKTQALLRIQFPTDDQPVVLSGIVAESLPKRSPPPMDAQVRMIFQGVSSRMENQLSRFITWVQIDMLKKGVK